jgi:hypothetical protein
MNPYTVILRRGAVFRDLPDYEPCDSYTAIVTGSTYREAVQAAKAEALAIDRKNFAEALDEQGVELTTDDYLFLVLFEGHHEPKLFGWQVF